MCHSSKLLYQKKKRLEMTSHFEDPESVHFTSVGAVFPSAQLDYQSTSTGKEQAEENSNRPIPQSDITRAKHDDLMRMSRREEERVKR